jgi:superfamily II DNA helicase RecQ
MLYLWQKNVFHALLEGKDMLISAGTGAGKSILFQAFCLLYLRAIVLVISPLKVLMEDQVRPPLAE